MRNFLFVAIFCLAAFLQCQAQEFIEIPMYDGIKTPELKQINDRFIAEVVKDFGSREAAAKDALKRGWAYMAKADWKFATRRFNQAWLLTPDNGEVFWGFGTATAYAGRYEEAEKYFSKAELTLKDNGRFLSDFALFYLYRANNRAKNKIGFGLDYIFREQYDPKWKADVAQYLDKALEFSERASKVAPNEKLAFINWAQALYGKDNYREAWGKVAKAEELGGQLNPKFIKALSKKMKRP